MNVSEMHCGVCSFSPFCHRDLSRDASWTSVVTHTVVVSSHTGTQLRFVGARSLGLRRDVPQAHDAPFWFAETGVRGSRPVTLVDHNGRYRLNSVALQCVSSYAVARIPHTSCAVFIRCRCAPPVAVDVKAPVVPRWPVSGRVASAAMKDAVHDAARARLATDQHPTRAERMAVKARRRRSRFDHPRRVHRNPPVIIRSYVRYAHAVP